MNSKSALLIVVALVIGVAIGFFAKGSMINPEDQGAKAGSATLNLPPVVNTATNKQAPVGAADLVFKSELKSGKNDSVEVLALQKALEWLGYVITDPAGTFSTSTEAAVKEFQTAFGLQVNGVVNAETEAKLYALFLNSSNTNKESQIGGGGVRRVNCANGRAMCSSCSVTCSSGICSGYKLCGEGQCLVGQCAYQL